MTDAIDLQDIQLKRGGFPALQGVTWRVPHGSCCAVLGPNGAGKSTLLAVITGHEWPTEGIVRVLGARYGRVELTRHRMKIGFVGHSRLPEFRQELTAYETVLAGRWGMLIVPNWLTTTPEDEQAVAAELAAVGMADRAETEFGRLSSGEQMRVLLARALVNQPDLLILDEPTAALDLVARAGFVAALERLIATRPAMTTLLVTHYVEDLPAGVREVLLLRAGRVVASGPVDTALTSATMSAAFGSDIELKRIAGRFAARVIHAEGWQMT